MSGSGLRAGIIGTGFMGTVHANAVRAAGGVVVAVASRSIEGATRAARGLGAAEVSRSADELISRDDVDVVHICTPNAVHAELAHKAISAGKSVICEKPLATTLSDATAIAAFAEASRTVTAIPFIYRFYPAVREARSRISAGDAGRLWLLHGSYLQDWLADEHVTDWRVSAAQGGGSRAFGDIGVHWCDLMEFVTGHRIAKIMAQTAMTFSERQSEGLTTPVDTEDGATLLFETDQGAIGSLVVSQVTPGRKNRLWFSFDGTEQSFSFDQEQPGTLWIGGAESSRQISVGSETLSTEQGKNYAVLPAGHPQGYQDAFNAFVRDAYAAICGNEVEGLPTFWDGLRATQLTDAMLRSASSGSWVSTPYSAHGAEPLVLQDTRI